MNYKERIASNKEKLCYNCYFDKTLAVEFIKELKDYLFNPQNDGDEIEPLLYQLLKDRKLIDAFFDKLPDVQVQLLEDAKFYLESDPACKSVEEVLFTYAGYVAIYTYRIAHLLVELNVDYLPRFLSEYAHSLSGVDINPKADISSPFFIDHGTGIVIGETTKIGKRVKLYQGVTLGAISLHNATSLIGVKRHPTIEDDVTIYANATVLGGNTIIKKGTVIKGSAFITKSNEE